MSVSVPPGSMVACTPRATVCKELGVKCHTDPQDPQPASELKLCFPLLWFPFHEDSRPETAEIYVGQGQRMCPKPTDGSHPTAFFLFRNTVSHSLEKHARNTYCVPGSGMMYHIFIYSSVDGHLGCLHFLAVVNSAAVNVGVHVSFQIMVFPRYYSQEWDCWLIC